MSTPEHVLTPLAKPEYSVRSSPSTDPAQARWFEREVYVHENSLRSYLRGVFSSVHDVEDVVQQSFLRIWKARSERSICYAKTFLFQIARHLAIDLIRHERRSPIVPATDFDVSSIMESGPDVAEQASTNHEITLLLEAIDSLPARCREIVILRKLQGISQKEIAARMQISEQTVQVQVARGVKRCEKFLIRRGVRGARA
jgi:RNA polymerase sigma-70 factor (ECF subfamily)